MKRYLTAVTIMLLPFLSIAQDVTITGTRKISEKMTPQQVIDSLHKTFPNAKAVKYYKADASTAKGWDVTQEGSTMAAAGDENYTISFKQEGLQYYGLYAPDGTLLESKIEHTMAELPAEVVMAVKALAKDYPGYKVVSKNYFKQQNYSKSKEYYEIVAKNGNSTKKFYYSPAGELIKVK
jgi:roadblock/LC7 domain-containing protein